MNLTDAIEHWSFWLELESLLIDTAGSVSIARVHASAWGCSAVMTVVFAGLLHPKSKLVSQ